MKAPTPEEVTALVRDAVDSCEGRHAIAWLQCIQARLGYIPQEAIEAIAGRLGVPAATVYGVATFYHQFRFTPPGKHHVRVCTGTACHIRGGQSILDEWRRRLGIREGEVTADRRYSLESVACVGCCALAPVCVVGETVHGRMTPNTVGDLLTRYALEDEREERGGE